MLTARIYWKTTVFGFIPKVVQTDHQVRNRQHLDDLLSLMNADNKGFHWGEIISGEDHGMATIPRR